MEMPPPMPPAGPMPPPAPSAPPPQAAPPLVMSQEDYRAWLTRVELARARRKREEDGWQRLLDGYLPPKDSSADTINSNIHFRNVEAKKAQLFFQLPDLQLTALDPLLGLVDPQGQPIEPYTLIATKRAVLNKLLGRDHANVLATMNEALFDILATSGVAATKICYEADFEPKPQMVPGPEQPMAGSVLGLQTVPSQVQQIVDVPIYERWRWYRFSPKRLLIPHDWHSTRFDDAPWLGMEFNLPLKEAIRQKLVPPDADGNTGSDTDSRFTHRGDTDRDDTGPRVKGVEIWARAVQFREQVYHSELFDYLVLIEGQDTPAQYKPSPYQDLGPDGRLTADSMIGNPIHPITLRDLSDTAWVPSDAAFTNPLVKQLNTWRSQDIKLRDANIPRFFYAESMKDKVDKLQDLDVGQGVPIPDEQMMQGRDKILAEVPHMERAQSDIQGEGSVRRDIDETLAIGSNQAGNVNNKVLSATEVATAQSNTNTRLQKERTVLVERYLSGCRKFDSLVQRFADQRDYVEIVGQTGAKKLQAWDKTTIAGRFAFDARADSQLSNDAATQRKDLLDFINFMAKSTFMNQAELARVATLAFGHDPARMVTEPQPPGPPPPNVSVKVNIEDLAGPAGQAAFKILQAAGYQLTEDDLKVAQANGLIIAQQEPVKQAVNTAHGGAADKGEVISKHTADETGAMPGRTPEGAPPAQTPGMIQ